MARRKTPLGGPGRSGSAPPAAFKLWVESVSALRRADPRWRDVVASVVLGADFSQDTFDCIRELQARGADGDRLLRMLWGLDRSQPVNVRFRVQSVKAVDALTTAAKEGAPLRERERKKYQSLRRFCEDERLRPLTRDAIREDVDAILARLDFLRKLKQDRPFPLLGVSVNPGGDVGRQGFWTRPLIAFVDYLAPILGSRRQAYKATAKLFELAYGYPGTWRHVERRVLHARKRRR